MIKELVPPAGSTARDLLAVLLEGTDVSEETLTAVEDVIRARRDSPVRVPRW